MLPNRGHIQVRILTQGHEGGRLVSIRNLLYFHRLAVRPAALGRATAVEYSINLQLKLQWNARATLCFRSHS